MSAENNWSRRKLMSATAAAGLTALMTPAAAARVMAGGAQQPNVLFILADDLGYADLGCYGRRDYKTPRLDMLATEGVQLFQGYANSSVCSATRTGLVTGRYQYRYTVGLEEPGGAGPDYGLPAGTPTMPGMFRKLGYHTSLIGKWHLGSPPGHGPRQHGYDSFYGIYGGGTDYFQYSEQPEKDAQLVDNGHPVDSHAYITDMLTDRAVAEINAASKARQPFFMSLHYTAPHWPWEGPEDRAKAEALTDIFDWDGGSIATYGRMVGNLDGNVGRVLDALSAAGLADNTIVVFTSDNGGERFSDTWPFIGIKTELLEGGLRVPLIVRWPGRIGQGTKSQQVMISMDFMPTLLAAAGQTDLTALNLDGQNVLPQLLGKAEPVSRKLFWRYRARDQAAVRDGDWKYLLLDGKEHLFDLGTDQRERADVKKRHPEKFAALKQEYALWNAQMLPYPADSYSHDMRENLYDR